MPKIKIDDKEYDTDELSDNARFYFVANNRSCVDSTPWVHTSDCGFSGQIVAPIAAE